MIEGLVNYLDSKTCITDYVDNISYKRPINYDKLSNYLYFTYQATRDGDGYIYRLQFYLFNKDTTKLEQLAFNLETLFIKGRKAVPEDLKLAFPKIWKCLLVSKVPFENESIITLDFQIYYNF